MLEKKKGTKKSCIQETPTLLTCADKRFYAAGNGHVWMDVWTDILKDRQMDGGMDGETRSGKPKEGRPLLGPAKNYSIMS